MYHRLLNQMADSLGALKNILTKIQSHLSEQGLEDNSILHARLAPDMFHFIRQIQASTDTAKNAAARLTGKTPPVFEDTEETFEQLHARIQRAIDYVRSFNEEDFSNADTVQITLPFAPGMYVLGVDYLHQFAIPNFYFHVTTAYAIARNQGIALGKRDYIPGMNFKPLEG